MGFGQCGCLQSGIEHRSTFYNILHMFNFIPYKRELVNGYSTTFRANSSDLHFYGIQTDDCLVNTWW